MGAVLADAAVSRAQQPVFALPPTAMPTHLMHGSNTDTTGASALRAAQFALRSGRARTAEQALRAMLASAPEDLRVQGLLAVALLDQGRPLESAQLLEAVVGHASAGPQAAVDLARAYRAAGRLEDARTRVRQVLDTQPHHEGAWLAYGDLLVDLHQYDDARTAFERARHCDPDRAHIAAATRALQADDRRGAEALFRHVLQKNPAQVWALCGLAALSLAADVPTDAERLLRHALCQSPHLPLAWRGLGPTLLALGRLPQATAAAQYLCRIEPENPQSWIATAAVAARLMRQEEALAAYLQAVRLQPDEVQLHTSLGHVQKTLGRRAQSEAAYKAALALVPGHAEAYWSLADLKNYRFSDAEVLDLQGHLADPKRAAASEAQWHFALGKAFEQRQRYTESFTHYAAGNARRRRDAPFDIDAFAARSAAIRAFFSADYFAAAPPSGAMSAAPIFIVGLPRAGSTLLEQILASHSAVEGTMELPNIPNIVRDLEPLGPGRTGYPHTLLTLPAERLSALGARYLEEVAPLRTQRPHFIDKLPNNFSHIGLIHRLLPNAMVIDARRHPLDCCLSAFKQHFAQGQTFSYDLSDLGRYYRTYLDLMDHWSAVLPGKVLTVQYEALLADPEVQIRRLLAHCKLQFEPACLRFHETRRSVRTASAEQVRQPLYTSSRGYWRHFDGALEPLRVALGDALDRCKDYE